MDKQMTFKITNEQGIDVEYEVLFTFESDETKKNYMVYTDNTKDEDGNIRVYASIYEPDKDETKLDPIQTEEEWTIIQKILDQLQEEVSDTIESLKNSGDE